MFGGIQRVKELIRTNDTVFISFLTHRLREEGIESFEMDSHMSLVEGSLGILPKRIMVADDEYESARKILDEARGSEIR
jgi:hypothetical protein